MIQSHKTDWPACIYKHAAGRRLSRLFKYLASSRRLARRGPSSSSQEEEWGPARRHDAVASGLIELKRCWRQRRRRRLQLQRIEEAPVRPVWWQVLRCDIRKCRRHAQRSCFASRGPFHITAEGPVASPFWPSGSGSWPRSPPIRGAPCNRLADSKAAAGEPANDGSNVLCGRSFVCSPKSRHWR